MPSIFVTFATRTPATSVIASRGPGAKNPKWKGNTARAATALRQSDRRKQPGTRSIQRMRVALDAVRQGPPAGSPVAARESMTSDTERGGHVILSLPEKLKVVKLWENLSAPALIEHAIARGEGVLGADGQLIVDTRPHTGRSPKDKFFVREPSSEKHIDWGDDEPADRARERFDALWDRVDDLSFRTRGLRLDCYVGADERYRVPLRVYTELAWQNLFARDLFITPERPEPDFVPEFTVVDAALFEADPARDGTRSGTFILVNFARRMILIGGTRYAGEIKKSVFTVMNYLLPLRDTLPMHCSANVGQGGDVAIFFGLSGTGKTTLSSDSPRPLIGDDEHGWSADGVFNFEGGCYAKVIRLSPTAEPEIWAATQSLRDRARERRLRRVARARSTSTPTRRPRTRARRIRSSSFRTSCPTSQGRPPEDDRHADRRRVRRACRRSRSSRATGDVSLPLRLHRQGRRHRTRRQRAAGDVLDLLRRAVHGAPSDGLREAARRKIDEHDVECWLVNTGWTGGPYGVGTRWRSRTRARWSTPRSKGGFATTTRPSRSSA